MQIMAVLLRARLPMFRPHPWLAFAPPVHTKAEMVTLTEPHSRVSDASSIMLCSRAKWCLPASTREPLDVRSVHEPAPMPGNRWNASSSHLDMASSPPSKSLSSITLGKGLLEGAAGRSAAVGVGATEGEPRRRLAERSSGEGVWALQRRQQTASAGSGQHAV